MLRAGAIALLLAAGLAMPAAAHAAGSTAIAPAEDARAQLAEILLPEEMLVDLAVRGFAKGAGRAEFSDPDLAALATRHPGLRAHVATALRPRFAKAIRKELPAFRQEIRAILAAELTDQEAGEALEFFGSPAGARLLGAAFAAIAEDPTRTEAQQQQAAMNAVMKALKPADYPAFMAFGTSGAARKMQTINPRVAAAGRTWSARMLAGQAPRLRKAALKEARKYAKAAEREQGRAG